VSETPGEEERPTPAWEAEAGYDPELDDPDDDTTGIEGDDDDAEGEDTPDIEPVVAEEERDE
jgi:hypothetical protein